MVNQQGLEQSRRHLSQILIVPGLRPIKGAFQQTWIANTGLASELLQHPIMDGQDFIERKEIDQFIWPEGSRVPCSQ